jgi:Na+/melibiose symporter-like transporter
VLGLVPLVVSFDMMKVVFLVTGMCYGLIKVAMYSTIGLVSPDRKAHASLLSFVEAFYKVGSLLTFVVFAAFTDDTHPESTSWANAYYVLAALMLTALGLLLATKTQSAERIAAAVRHGRQGTAMKAFQGILNDREITAVAA